MTCHSTGIPFHDRRHRAEIGEKKVFALPKNRNRGKLDFAFHSPSKSLQLALALVRISCEAHEPGNRLIW